MHVLLWSPWSVSSWLLCRAVPLVSWIVSSLFQQWVILKPCRRFVMAALQKHFMRRGAVVLLVAFSESPILSLDGSLDSPVFAINQITRGINPAWPIDWWPKYRLQICLQTASNWSMFIVLAVNYCADPVESRACRRSDALQRQRFARMKRAVNSPIASGSIIRLEPSNIAHPFAESPPPFKRHKASKACVSSIYL